MTKLSLYQIITTPELLDVMVEQPERKSHEEKMRYLEEHIRPSRAAIKVRKMRPNPLKDL